MLTCSSTKRASTSGICLTTSRPRSLEPRRVHDRSSSILSTCCGSGLVSCFCTCCVSFRATSWMISSHSMTGRFSSSWLRVQGLIGRCFFPNARPSPIRATVSVSFVLSWAKASCASKRWERGIRTWSSCVIRPLLCGLLWVRVDCHTSVLWSRCGKTQSANPRTQTKRHASSSPSLLVSLGAGHFALVCACGIGRRCILSWPVRQLANADGHAVLPQRIADGSPVTASLTASLTACRTRRR